MIKIKSVKCPKCKGVDTLTEIVEIYEQPFRFLVEGNRRSPEGGAGNPGSIIGVFATCACGKTWKLRGVDQIDDMDVDE